MLGAYRAGYDLRTAGKQGVLRMFVPANRDEIALYIGSLIASELRYRGPVPPATELRQWLCGDLRQLPPRGATAPLAGQG